jgi:hypothetical protein
VIVLAIEDKTFSWLIIAVSLAFAWILWPFYGAVLWATIIAILFLRRSDDREQGQSDTANRQFEALNVPPSAPYIRSHVFVCRIPHILRASITGSYGSGRHQTGIARPVTRLKRTAP